jgi:formylmethanofuran dehydrogenase subunit E-like metal-binding protein
MRKYFEKSNIILDYNKWDNIVNNIGKYQDNLNVSYTRSEFEFMFRLIDRIPTKHDMVISFVDYIDVVKNEVDPSF